jgi:hypothetical protein
MSVASAPIGRLVVGPLGGGYPGHAGILDAEFLAQERQLLFDLVAFRPQPDALAPS